MKQWRWFGLLVVTIGFFCGQLAIAPPARAGIADWTREQRYLTEVWKIVNRTYVDDTFNHQNWYDVRRAYAGKHLNSRTETYAAVREMLASLDDPFTRLLEPDQFRSMQTSTSGALTGVGLQIAIDPESKAPVVISPIADSPADRAGVRPRDLIVRIDGLPTAGLSLDECASRMRGELGTKVTLAIARPQAAEDGTVEEFEVFLVRERVEVNPVIAKLNREGDLQVGYIRLTQFNGNAASEMARAIDTLERQGAQAYVLDLRGNPGGLLAAGIEIARMWLPSGPIVYTVDRNGISDTFAAEGNARTTAPLAILIDGGTASASEILAGALQENDRAVLVGTRSFGKGLVQSLFELDDGAGLAVTIARYETPKHHNIHRLGIQPDIEIDLDRPLGRDRLATADDGQYLAAVAAVAHPATTVARPLGASVPAAA